MIFEVAYEEGEILVTFRCKDEEQFKRLMSTVTLNEDVGGEKHG